MENANTAVQFDDFGNIVERQFDATVNTDVSTEAAIVTEKPKQTRIEKLLTRVEVLNKRIAADTAERDRVLLESTTAGRLDGVQEGTSIIARLGRAGSAAVEAVVALPERLSEDGVTVLPAVAAVAAKAATEGTLKNVKAEVLGVREHTDGSLRFKVGFGEGFDADTAIIQSTQIVEVLVAA